MFPGEVTAKCVRLHPTKFTGAAALRFDVLGCRTFGRSSSALTQGHMYMCNH